MTALFGKYGLTRFCRCWPALLGVLWIAYAPPSAATAQQPERGVLNAVSFEPLPEGAAVLVRPLDDTDENLAIKKEFEAAMAADGLNVAADDARLVLSFETREEVAAGPAPRPQTTVRFRGQEGRMSMSDAKKRAQADRSAARRHPDLSPEPLPHRCDDRRQIGRDTPVARLGRCRPRRAHPPYFSPRPWYRRSSTASAAT